MDRRPDDFCFAAVGRDVHGHMHRMVRLVQERAVRARQVPSFVLQVDDFAFFSERDDERALALERADGLLLHDPADAGDFEHQRRCLSHEASTGRSEGPARIRQ
ncbi:MAG TPA: hypothetical protein VEU33_44970 [Archangium sp.]|nr:hypothetical protein [Archangium sp.]